MLWHLYLASEGPLYISDDLLSCFESWIPFHSYYHTDKPHQGTVWVTKMHGARWKRCHRNEKFTFLRKRWWTALFCNHLTSIIARAIHWSLLPSEWQCEAIIVVTSKKIFTWAQFHFSKSSPKISFKCAVLSATHISSEYLSTLQSRTPLIWRTIFSLSL